MSIATFDTLHAHELKQFWLKKYYKTVIYVTINIQVAWDLTEYG